MKNSRMQGYNLIELIVTMAIIAILAKAVTASYANNVYKSNRSEATAALLDIAAREEKYFATNFSYTRDMSKLGLASSTTDSYTTPKGNYTIKITSDAPSDPQPKDFTLTATAQGNQTKDICKTYTYNNTGVKGVTATAAATAAATVALCW